jgi:methyltransferase family protein
MKSVALIFAGVLLFGSHDAQAQGFRGGFGGGGRGGFTGPAPSSGAPAGRSSPAPQRSVNPQFQRSNPPLAAQPQIHGMPSRAGIHHIPPVFAPFDRGKVLNPFVPFVPAQLRRDRFFRHRHGAVVIFGVPHFFGVSPFFGGPQFVGTTVITEVAPGVIRQERRYLEDSPADARVREPGQLAPYDPTPHEVVERMLVLAQVRKNDVIYDLGSGDGRLLITAAKKYGVRGVGFEIEPGLVKLARENSRREGVEKLVEIRQQDFLSADLSPASVVTLYLSYDGNLAVREQLKRQLKPGARVVSYTFDMGDWPPKIAESYRDAAGETHALYLWEITEPALYSQSSPQIIQPQPSRDGPLIIEVK